MPDPTTPQEIKSIPVLAECSSTRGHPQRRYAGINVHLREFRSRLVAVWPKLATKIPKKSNAFRQGFVALILNCTASLRF